MKPLLSVIMPVYNCKEYIEESIKSICTQTYQNYELIIININSTDNIDEEIKKVHDERIQYHSSTECNTLFSALKYGLQQAHGDFITFHDPDDISSPTRFDEQINYLKSHEDLGMVSCLIRCFTSEPSYRNACTFIEKIQNSYISKYQIENAIINGFSPIIFPTLMIRKSLLAGFEFRKKENEIEDYFHVLLYLLKQGSLEKINTILYYYRRHTKSYHILNEKAYMKTVESQLSSSRIKDFVKYRELYRDLQKEQTRSNTVQENSPLRVLMLIDALNIGGTEMHVLEIARKLVKLGAYVVIGTSGGPLEEVFKHYGLKVIKIPFTSDYISNKNIMGLIKLTKEIIDREEINLLHCHLFASMRLGNDIYRSYKIPYIVTLHGLFYPNDILFNSCINASKIIAVSEPVKNLIQLKLGSRIRGEILVLPNGIDINNFYYQHTSKDFKKSLSIPEDSQIVTYCSRLDWGKTIAAESFIFGCYQLMVANSHLCAVIVGDGADKDLITREADILNKMLKRKAFHVIGATFNVLPYYQNAVVVVGTARVALEAMSCGKPVIGVGNQGYTGIIDPESMSKQWNMYFGDHDALEKPDALTIAEDLKTLLLNSKKCETLGKWSRNWCKEKFDSQLIVKSILDLYEEVLFEKKGDENSKKKIPECGQMRDKLLVEKTSIVTITLPQEMGFSPEVTEVLFNSKAAIVRYCSNCSNRGLHITIPLTIILSNKKDPCKILKVYDLLHLNFNSYKCNGCDYKKKIDCETLINLNNKSGIKIKNEIINKSFIDKDKENIKLEILTRIYVNCCDPGISNLETGLYGSSSIINEDKVPVICTGKEKFEKDTDIASIIKAHHDHSYCYTDKCCGYKVHHLMKKYSIKRCHTPFKPDDKCSKSSYDLCSTIIVDPSDPLKNGARLLTVKIKVTNVCFNKKVAVAVIIYDAHHKILAFKGFTKTLRRPNECNENICDTIDHKLVFILPDDDEFDPSKLEIILKSNYIYP